MGKTYIRMTQGKTIVFILGQFLSKLISYFFCQERWSWSKTLEKSILSEVSNVPLNTELQKQTRTNILTSTSLWKKGGMTHPTIFWHTYFITMKKARCTDVQGQPWQFDSYTTSTIVCCWNPITSMLGSMPSHWSMLRRNIRQRMVNGCQFCFINSWRDIRKLPASS